MEQCKHWREREERHRYRYASKSMIDAHNIVKRVLTV
jgi:hypothetical protein